MSRAHSVLSVYRRSVTFLFSPGKSISLRSLHVSESRGTSSGVQQGAAYKSSKQCADAHPRASDTLRCIRLRLPITTLFLLSIAPKSWSPAMLRTPFRAFFCTKDNRRAWRAPCLSTPARRSHSFTFSGWRSRAPCD